METNSFSVLCYIRKSRLNQQGEANLFLRITANYKRAEFSIQRKVKPEKWCSIRGRVKGSNPQSKALNHYIDELESKAYNIHSKLVLKKKPFTAETIKHKILNTESTNKTVLEVYDEHNNQIEQLLGLEYSYGAYRRHIRTRNHLADFVQKEYKIKDIFIKEVDLKFINRFNHYLKTKKIGNQNTVTKYVVNFKKIMRIAAANNWVNKDPFYHWKAKWKRVERDILTELELRSLIEQEFDVPRLEQVRDIFVFSCFTGLAYVDVKKLSSNHIVISLDGKRCVKINRSKTDSRSVVPLLPTSEEILSKYRDHPLTKKNGLLLPVISNQKTNAFLKEIAAICKIQKNLTFHLARHTFATTVTLANGVPIESVSKMLGHQSLKTTQIYAKVIDKKLMEDMEVVRGKFGLAK
ncbi:tyrosine-type recombinase/integrase [Muricauda sp. JGD-17]|uniref:Tyrosine-type recombinase/integrase n=1 Tax=Flagellimonas ochracea TaxID=2696472 RepID=A0A964TFK3_9FLAO|nr:site-specific integrase [Allomuricauda ochracea]NAY93348.1 tyrosine-type recombinase/integrase [Allomuricauda ochracea]